MSEGPDGLGVEIELYRLPLTEFVAARKELARRVRLEGDREEALHIGSLAKPSLPAWVVNQLYHASDDPLAGLFAAGAEVREAQEASDVEGLRRAMTARREVTEALLARAAETLGESGQAATESTLQRVRTTLEALATLGRGAARDGCLIEELQPPGFDALLALGFTPTAPPAAKARTRTKASRSSASAAATPKRAPDPTPSPERVAAREALAEAEGELEACRRRLQAAEASRLEAESEAAKARDLAEVRRREVQVAEEEAQRLEAEAAARVEAFETARQAVGEWEAAVEEARSLLKAL